MRHVLFRSVTVAVTVAGVVTGGMTVVAPAGAVTAVTEAPVTSQADSSRPDVVSAQVAARVSGRRVLVTGLSSEVSSTWVNPDGTLSTDESSQPVQAKDGAGVWRPLDETLGARPDGTVKPALSAAGASFAGAGSRSAARLVSVVGGTGFDWSTALPAPVLAGDTATYPNVLTGTDLTATATATGFELSLVVKAKPVSALPASISLPLRGSGLTWALSAGGVLTGATAAGKVVVTSSGAQAYDAATDPVTGMPLHSVALELALSGTTGAQSLVVTVPTAFLNAASTVYPVTIDPSASWTRTAWAFVDAAAPTTVYYNTTSGGRVGPYDTAGTHRSRSFYTFATPALTGKHFLSATFKINETTAVDCTARPFEVWSTGAPTSATTWNNQPTWGTKYATISSNAGGGTGCPAAQVSGDVTAWAQNVLAAGYTSATLGLKVNTSYESASAYFKQFNAAASISLNYNSYPSSLSQLSVSPCAAGCPATGTRYVGTARPTFSSYATDADNGQIAHYFSIQTAANPGTDLIIGHSTASGNGSISWQVPSASALPDGDYTYKAWAFDGTDNGPTSSATAFTVDATAPSGPTIASSGQPAGTLTTSSDFTFTISPNSSDTTAYAFKLENGVYSAWVTSTTVTIPNVNKDALHTLSVLASDRAGNRSAPSTYSFGGGLTSPSDQDQTQRYVTLSAAAPSTYSYVSYQWRKGTTVAWGAVPSGDVAITGGGSPTSWPVSPIATSYVWNLASTMTSTDGLAEVRACLYTTPTDPSPVCLDPNDVTLAINAFGDSATTSPIGPGEVSLLTGDFQVSASDVSVPSFNGGLSTGRSSTTLPTPVETAGPTGVYGPGWSADLPGTSTGAAASSLNDQTANGYVSIISSNGSSTTYRATSSLTTYPVLFAGVGDATAGGAVLQKVNATTFTLTGRDGSVTTWTSGSGGWFAASVQEPGSQTATTYTRDGSGRITRILAPVPAGISCSSAPDTTPGCRSLKLTYTTITVGGVPFTRLQTVAFVAYDPQTSAMASVEVESYDYDTNGRLFHAWDPRVTPNLLKTTYTYDSTGRLSTITPPGLAAWTLSYDVSHRLASVKRPDGTVTATSTVAYDVPVAGGSAPIDLSAATASTWGQTGDTPVAATAIFGPDHVPAATPTSTDWPYSTISYLDANGREVNTAQYGVGQWLVDTSRYDSHGNVVWSLTADNRAQALIPTSDTDAAAAAAQTTDQSADLLATVNVYNADGSELLDTLGPVHPVQLDNGILIDARSHSHVDYDQGAPATGGKYELPTTGTGTVQDINGTDYDAQIIRTSYDIVNSADPNEKSGWELHEPTTTTTQMGSMPSTANDLVRTTRYDIYGKTIETRLPLAAAGGTAGDTVTSYYTATGTGNCVSAALAGMLCSTGPAVQPSTGNPLSVTTTTYNLYDQPRVVTETAGTTVRTTTNTYDAAARFTSTAIMVTPTAAGGTALPAKTFGYDPNTGLPTTVTASGVNLTTGYDNLARVTSYTDASGDAGSSTTYDTSGRVKTFNDGKGTYTYTYDSATEHRGLLTSEALGVGAAPGTITTDYDAAGNPATVTYPNGLVAVTDHDNVGSDTALTYAKSGITWMSFARAQGSDGSTAAQSSPSSTQFFSYDNARRLTQTRDFVPDPVANTVQCTLRTYTLDKNSNRLSLASYPDDGAAPSDGHCDTGTTPITSTGSYDQADRLTNTGYTYDALGRTTTLPAIDALGSGSHAATTGNLAIGYYSNDFVASQSQGFRTSTFGLDALQNRVVTNVDGSTTTTNHFADGGDSPSWTSTSTSTSTSAAAWTRNLIGPAGLTGTLDQTGMVTLQLANMHGDIVATVADDTSAAGIAGYSEASEYGTPRNPAAAPEQYGWLGGERRSSNDLAGLTLMGARLYNPATGRFLSIDPLPGGSWNAYEYANANPIDKIDLDGKEVVQQHWMFNMFRTSGQNDLWNFDYKIQCLDPRHELSKRGLITGLVNVSYDNKLVADFYVSIYAGGESKILHHRNHEGYNFLSVSVRLINPNTGRTLGNRQIFRRVTYIN